MFDLKSKIKFILIIFIFLRIKRTEIDGVEFISQMIVSIFLLKIIVGIKKKDLI